MGKLIYLLNVSLDGFVETADRGLEWTIVGQFVRRGLVDEYRLVVHPVVLGAGTPFWPELDAPLRLQFTEAQRFSSGVEFRSYVPA